MSPRVLSCVAAAALAITCVTAEAATVSLAPVIQNVALGDPVSLQLSMDFTDDPTIGGGIDLFYDDSVLQFVSFTFDSGLGDDPDYRRQPDVLPGELDALAFGNFAGMSGPSLVGTFTFNTLAGGSVNLTLAQNDSVAGGFISASTYDPQDVTPGGATVNVSAVPLPAAGWLFASGLGLMAGLRKKTKARSPRGAA